MDRPIENTHADIHTNSCCSCSMYILLYAMLVMILFVCNVILSSPCTCLMYCSIWTPSVNKLLLLLDKVLSPLPNVKSAISLLFLKLHRKQETFLEREEAWHAAVVFFLTSEKQTHWKHACRHTYECCSSTLVLSVTVPQPCCSLTHDPSTPCCGRGNIDICGC